MEKINQISVERYTGVKVSEAFECAYFGMSNTKNKKTIAFVDEERYLSEIISNDNITVVFCLKEMLSLLENKIAIVCDDPRFTFYNYYNKITEANYVKFKSRINSNARIHSSAYVSEYNVVIDEGTYVGPNATILPGVEIGKDCYIKSGAVIGSEGFEIKRTSKGMLNVLHDGKVIIGNNVKIGANCAIHLGFSFRNTIISNEVKIDDLVYIAHGVQIGKGCLLIGKSMISGSATLKEDIWVGPGVIVSNGITIESDAYLTMGSVVTRDVSKGLKVTGNFAIDHDKFISNLKDVVKKPI